MTKTIELTQGAIRYRDLGAADGEPIVFVHGLLVDGRLWKGVADALESDFRCLVPDWPMGSHELPMDDDADLSPVGQAQLVADFIAAVGLDRATVVGNDSGGAISQLVATRHPDRVGRLVLTNCDMFENFPPFPFTLMPPIARLPGGMRMLQAPFRIRAVGRRVYGLFAERPLAPELVDSWLEPGLRDADIARDTRRLIVGAHKQLTIEAAERLRGFERPALLAWGVEDRFFKLSDAARMAELIPDARLVEIGGAKTFSPLDQPREIASAIAAFMRETAGAPVS